MKNYNMVGLGGMLTRGKFTVPLSPLRQNITEYISQKAKTIVITDSV